jgi:hypothetical protein
MVRRVRPLMHRTGVGPIACPAIGDGSWMVKGEDLMLEDGA